MNYYDVKLNLNDGIIRNYTVYTSDAFRAIIEATKQAKYEGYTNVVLEEWKVVK